MKPEGSVEHHQTLSSRVGSGHETTTCNYWTETWVFSHCFSLLYRVPKDQEVQNQPITQNDFFNLMVIVDHVIVLLCCLFYGVMCPKLNMNNHSFAFGCVCTYVCLYCLNKINVYFNTWSPQLHMADFQVSLAQLHNVCSCTRTDTPFTNYATIPHSVWFKSNHFRAQSLLHLQWPRFKGHDWKNHHDLQTQSVTHAVTCWKCAVTNEIIHDHSIWYSIHWTW